jgi:hypothetical protein
MAYGLGPIYRRYDFPDWTHRERPPRYGKTLLVLLSLPTVWRKRLLHGWWRPHEAWIALIRMPQLLIAYLQTPSYCPRNITWCCSKWSSVRFSGTGKSHTYGDWWRSKPRDTSTVSATTFIVSLQSSRSKGNDWWRGSGIFLPHSELIIHTLESFFFEKDIHISLLQLHSSNLKRLFLELLLNFALTQRSDIQTWWPCTCFQRKISTAAARVRARVWSCRICGGQSLAGAGFLRVLRSPLPIFIPPIAPQSPSSII